MIPALVRIAKTDFPRLNSRGPIEAVYTDLVSGRSGGAFRG